MSGAERVRKHRERVRADGRRRYEFMLTAAQAEEVQRLVATQRKREAETKTRWPQRPVAPEEIALDPRLAKSWPMETWADYIAFAQAGWEGLDRDMEEPLIERDRTTSPVYGMEFD